MQTCALLGSQFGVHRKFVRISVSCEQIYSSKALCLSLFSVVDMF